MVCEQEYGTKYKKMILIRVSKLVFNYGARDEN